MIVEARSPPALQQMAPGIDHLSYSSISLYQQCSLRWAFHYLHGLPEGVVSASLLFGSGVHSAIEVQFRELLHGHGAPPLDVLLDAFWQPWRDLEGTEVRFNKGEDVNTIGKLAERVLRAFQDSDLARPHGTIIAIEEQFRGQLVPGVPDLLARVDLIVETDDEVVVQDFKTSRSTWAPDHVEDAAGQLIVYHELLKPLAGDKPLRLEFAVLTKTKVPELAVHHVEPDARQIERTKRIVERVWRGIEIGHFVPSPSPTNCPGCPFRAECRAWTG